MAERRPVVIAGHFGFAAIVKSRVTSAPTWCLMLASVFMDVVFVPLLLTGVETMQPYDGGDGKAYGAAIIHADYTHSILGAIALSVVFGIACALPWGKKIGAVMGAVVFSHWVLDLPMHHHDMPLFPGKAGTLGFGLWSYPAIAAALELAIVIAGAWLYWNAARPLDPKRGKTCAILVAAFGVLTLGLNLVGV
ncbi:MAG: hypothetical protein QM831_31970 [Kofleriaceae bacterium]